VHQLERETEAHRPCADRRLQMVGQIGDLELEERREELADGAGDEVAITLELAHVAEAQLADRVRTAGELAHATRHLEHVRSNGGALLERERAEAAEDPARLAAEVVVVASMTEAQSHRP